MATIEQLISKYRYVELGDVRFVDEHGGRARRAYIKMLVDGFGTRKMHVNQSIEDVRKNLAVDGIRPATFREALLLGLKEKPENQYSQMFVLGTVTVIYTLYPRIMVPYFYARRGQWVVGVRDLAMVGISEYSRAAVVKVK